jgi:predicted ester cyclase
MAIAILMEFDGDLETHIKISEALGDAPVTGLIVHGGGPSQHGVHSLDVWETKDDSERFFSERLAAALRQLGFEGGQPLSYQEFDLPHLVRGQVLSPHDPDMNPSSETEGNKAVIRRFVEEVQNKQDWAAYDELNDPGFVNLSSPPGAPVDREGGKFYLQALAAAYPDAVFTIDDMFAEGDAVITRKTFTGTNEREFMGVPATGRRVSLQYVDIMRVRDGRIINHWNVLDQLSWMIQLGLIPDPSSSSSE